jgi:hypothetical protein
MKGLHCAAAGEAVRKALAVSIMSKSGLARRVKKRLVFASGLDSACLETP